MIASVAFRNFKALRNTSLKLAQFNLILGPNGSGKTSLIEAVSQLRTLAPLPPAGPATAPVSGGGPDLTFRFEPPHADLAVRLGCVDDTVCDALQVSPPDAPDWPVLRTAIARIRRYAFDGVAMAVPPLARDGAELGPNGANLAAVLARLRDTAPASYAGFVAEALRLFPEFSRFDPESVGSDRVALAFAVAGERSVVRGDQLSHGTLHTLALLALAFAPSPPGVVCIEEVDRGIHPRRLREIRDTLYRLSYPAASGLKRPAVQVIATTHSPYLLDLFRDHPEEIVFTRKRGSASTFERLADRADLPQLLEEGSLGDLWFSGILGGVPEDPA